MRVVRRIALSLTAVVASLAVLAAAGILWLRSDDGRAWLAAEIGRRASTPGTLQVSIGGLDGDLFRSLALTDIAARDSGGPWLAIRSVAVDWRLLDLLHGRLTLDRVDVREARLERLPQQRPEADGRTLAERLDALQGLMAIRIASLGIEDMTLGAPVLGEAAVLRVSGRVETAADVVRGALSIRRVDGTDGSLEAKAEYRTSDATLAVDAVLSEPSGGLLARALDIPGLPPLRAEAKGTGPLSDWRGRAALSFENAAAMEADVRIRHAGTTDFSLSGKATIPQSDGGTLRHFVSGAHRFRIGGRYGPGDVVALSDVEWTAPAFALAGSGKLQLDDLAVDARATVRTTGAAPLPLTPNGVTVAAMTADATATGQLSAPALRLSFQAGRLSVPDLAIGDVAGDVTFKAATMERGTLDGTATLKAIDWLGRPAAQSLLGDSMTLQIAGTVDDRRSEVRIERAEIGAAHGTLTGSGDFGWGDGGGAAKATLTLSDLAPVGAAAGQTMSGRANLTLDGAVQAFGASATAALSGKATGLALGNAVDAVLAGEATLNATVSLANGKIEAKRAVVKTAMAEAQLDAAVDMETRVLAGDYRLTVAGGKPFLAADGVDVECACGATGKLRGTLDDPGIAGDLTVRAVRIRTVALRTAKATYDMAKLIAAPSGTIALKAESPVGDLAARTKLAVEPSRLRLREIEATAGSARLNGTLDVALSDAPLGGDIAVAIADMRPWLAAAGLDGEGRSSAKVVLRAQGKQQVIDGTATLDGIRLRRAPGAPVLSIAQATVDAAVTNPQTDSGNRVDLRIAKAGYGEASFENVAMAARGSLAQAQLSLTGKGNWQGPLTADVAATYSDKAGRAALEVTKLQGTLFDEKVSLERPLQAAWGDSRLSAETPSLRFGDAQMSGHVRLGKADADVSLAISGLPLKMIDRLWPLGLDGQANAALAFKGPLPQPDGTLSLDIPRLRFHGEPNAPTLAVGIDGDWRRGRLAIRGKVDAGKGDPSVVEASVPLRLEAPDWYVSMPREQPVSATLRWAGETATLWRFVPVSEHLLRGAGKIDVALKGTLAQPVLDGSLTLTDGYYESLEYGAILRSIDLALALEGRRLRIVRLTAGDGGDGKLDGGGTVTLDPEAGFPLAITTKLAKLTAVRRDDVQAAASGNLTVSGTLRKAKIVSELTTDQVEVRVLDRLPPEVATLDVVELARAGARPPPDKPDAAPPVDADLDIRVEMPRRVFVRGRGIDSEWKGNVKVDGTASAPIVAGYLSLVRGQMTVVGKTFHMESGSFFLPEQGNNEPEMSLVAVHTARSLTVRAQVEGPVSRPTITLSSSPSLPQEEIVSQVLFNKSSSKLSVYEAAQLGIALSELTGKGGAGGVLDFVRKTLGVDSLQVESTETAKGSTPVVGAGKYLTDDVYVGVKQGATPESGSVGVEVEVTPHISVESEVKRSGQSDVGVKFKYDY
jgi:translocation and assembly module TamB